MHRFPIGLRYVVERSSPLIPIPHFQRTLLNILSSICTPFLSPLPPRIQDGENPKNRLMSQKTLEGIDIKIEV